MNFPPPDSTEFKRALERRFDPLSIRRGQAYFRAGKVREIEVDTHDAGWSAVGQVQGSGALPYRTSLTLGASQRGFAVLDDSCSCPLEGLCKHAVALLLAVADRFAGLASPSTAETPADLPPPTTPWDQWFATGRGVSPLTTPPDEQRLAFVFDLANANPLPVLTVKAVWLSRLKTGGWGKPEPVRVASWAPGGNILRLDPDQFALVSSVRMFEPCHGTGTDSFRLDGRHAGSVVESLLAGQMCLWQKPRDGEFKGGDPVPLRWRWQLQVDGNQKLLADAGAGVILLRAGGLWYFDPAARRLGRVEHDLALAERLLRMPPLIPEHIAHVTRRWRDEPGLAALPLPEAQPPVRIIRTPPAAVLSLSRIAPDPRTLASQPKWMRQASESLFAYVARLAFVYEGQRVDAGSQDQQERRFVDGRLLSIQRDQRAERQVAMRLQDLGLKRAKQHANVPWLVAARITEADWMPSHPHAPNDATVLAALVPALLAAGLRVEFGADFPIELLPAPDAWYGDIDESSGMDWFGVELGIVIGGERVSLLPIIARAIEDRRFPLHATADEKPDAVWYAPLDARRRVPLPLARVRALLAPLLEWLSTTERTLRVPRLAVDVLADLQARAGDGLLIGGAASATALAERLRAAGRDLHLPAPEGLQATPRPYQLDGLRWLQFLADAGLGGVLADDMGLGKTLQVLMHLLAEKACGRLDAPALVVCPTSVIGNWCEQAARFAPSLRVLVLHGSARAGDFERIGSHDLIVTTYALLVRDRAELVARPFALAVFDEAQAIKNPLSQAAQVARALKARRKLAVTGTPLENHLGELWTQFDCVLPGLLGSREHFTKFFRGPIEKHADAERQQRLERRIAPFMLRRSKEAVAPELPPKTVIERKVELAGAQRELYETLRLAMHERVREALGKRGLARSNIVVLDALLKLRQVCCDPRLVRFESGKRRAEPPASAKLALLQEMLDELRDEGRRVLLFSQFTGMLDLIEHDLRQHDRAFVRLDGSTTDRDTPIRRFQSGEVPLFLISLKAGGVGLNLTAADTVIHYDPWWNPAAENQATDRAHRIGQDKPVFVYKLTCTGTVEEKIQALQQRKAGLAKAILEGGTRTALRFDEADIEDLFAPVG